MKNDNCCTPSNCFKWGFAGALFFTIILAIGWAGWGFGNWCFKTYHHRIVLTVHEGDIVKIKEYGQTPYYIYAYASFRNDQVFRADDTQEGIRFMNGDLSGFKLLKRYRIGKYPWPEGFYLEATTMSNWPIGPNAEVVGHADWNLIENVTDK